MPCNSYGSTFKKYLFILIGGQSLDNIVVVFAILRHEQFAVEQIEMVLQSQIYIEFTILNTNTCFRKSVIQSISQSYLTLCDPTDCSKPVPLSSTISWSLLKFFSIESVILSISSSAAPSFFCLQSFPASGSFPRSGLQKIQTTN